MINLNKQLEELGPFGKLQSMVHLQTYLALTISDFMKERSQIETTSLLTSCLHLWPHAHGKAIINFQNVCYTRLAPDQVQLEDMTTELQMGIYHAPHLERILFEQGISSGDKIQWASIVYDPKKDIGALSYLQKSLDMGKPEKVKYSLQELAMNR